LFEQISLYLLLQKIGVIMAKKSTEIKFTQEELTSLKELQQGYDNVRSGLGALELSRINLEQRLEGLSNEKFRIEAEYTKLQETEQRLEQISNEKLRLETQYIQLNQKELDLVNELNEKYGAGNLDPTTGIFTPTK